MKIAGIVGGIGPESTIEYYRLIVAAYREQVRDGSYPRLLINSIDLKEMLDLIAADKLPEVTALLAAQVAALGRAGAEFAVLAANTPHLVFDAVRTRSPITLISIVEVTCAAAQALGLRRVGLLGTRFTMQGRFYPDGFAQAGIAVVVPAPAEQAYVHDTYMNELVPGRFVPETRSQLLALVETMHRRDGIQAVILGGTELSPVFHDVSHLSVPVLDTTRLHAAAIVARMLS